MKKKDGKARLCMDEYWFNKFMAALEELNEECTWLIEHNYPNNVDFNTVLKRDNDAIIDKITRFAWYEEKSGYKEVRIELYPSEMRDIIWQLLAYLELNIQTRDNPTGYEKYKENHEKFLNGELTLAKILTKAAAKELYNNWRVGGTYLVKNKDGSCYVVDHGCTELVKLEDHWEDRVYGTEDFVFWKLKRNYEIVSWEDDTPLNIGDYLKENNWLTKASSQNLFLDF